MFLVDAKEVSLTFDDAPMADSSLYSGDERTRILIDVLKKHRIQTVFFSISGNLEKSNGLERMKRYVDAGHLIANHTHTHPNYNQLSFKDYAENFDKADSALRGFKTFRPWFRFPMLKHGETIEKRDQMRNHLRIKKYLNGYVTLDIQDWFMASLLSEGVKANKKVNQNNMCNAYAELISETMEFYEKKAVEILKKSPKHMLLLHENDLAALCVTTLIQKITSLGWKIISPDEAMTDEIYKRDPHTLFNDNGLIAALYHEKKGEKIHDPWSFPWDDGKLIRNEFNKRKVFD